LSAKLISIIGPPAVGKTTLAELLAAELPARLVREDYVGNPFLADSYAGKADALLPGQIYFLMSRVGQLRRAAWPAEGLVVSDYGFCQDRVFARQRLSAEDFRLYERIASRVESLVWPPNLLIRLDASEPALLERISLRGRPFERTMDAAFLAAMRKAYNKVEAGDGCRVMTLDTEAINLLEPSGRRLVATKIKEVVAKLD